MSVVDGMAAQAQHGHWWLWVPARASLGRDDVNLVLLKIKQIEFVMPGLVPGIHVFTT
jgi:hypothetical protein